MAPPDARFGVIVTPRALQLLEGGATEVQALLARPELAAMAGELDERIRAALGGPFTDLAALGIDRDRGFALWQLPDDGAVAVIPVADAATLKKLLGDDAADPARIAGLTCRPNGAMHVCASDPTLLAKLGKAKPPAELATVGARGDIELVMTGAEPVAVVAQLDPGEVVVRLARKGALPPELTAALGGSAKPRVDATTASFGVAALGPLLQMAPDGPLPGGVRLKDVAAKVAGPLTITVAGGSRVFDVRVPLRDPEPLSTVLSHCDELIPPHMRAATSTPGACRFLVPDAAMELDVWIDGKQLRIGDKNAPAGGKRVELSPLGRELAGREWAFAMWGRGTVFDTGALALPGMEGAGDVVARALTLVNELGIAVRLDGNVVHGVIGVRTLWSNPRDVVEKVLAVPSADLVAGKAKPTAEAIAGAAPRAPFAQDFAAGGGGLMVPAAGVGMVAAVAIPAFMDYMKTGKRSEAELHLEAIAKSARTQYVVDGALPKLTAPLTPARSCCEYPSRRCEPNDADWQTPAWDALDFMTVEPHYFRYAYESDGATLTATAVGDLDCDGNEVTYTLTITTTGGTPHVTLTKPTTPD